MRADRLPIWVHITGGEFPMTMAADERGCLWTLNHMGDITKWDRYHEMDYSDGDRVDCNPVEACIVPQSDGGVCVVSKEGTVFEIDSDLELRKQYPCPPSLKFVPSDIAYDRSGQKLMCNYEEGCVDVFSPDGLLVTRFSCGANAKSGYRFQSLVCLCIGQDGFIFCARRFGHSRDGRAV